MMCKWVTIVVDTWRGKKCKAIHVPYNPNTFNEELVRTVHEIYNNRLIK